MSKRLAQIEELIKRELGKIILEEIEFPTNVMVTISRVKVTADLKDCQVYCSVIPDEKSPQILRLLQKNIITLQHALNKKLFMHHLPKIIFFSDFTEQKASRLEALLDKIKEKE